MTTFALIFAAQEAFFRGYPQKMTEHLEISGKVFIFAANYAINGNGNGTDRIELRRLAGSHITGQEVLEALLASLIGHDLKEGFSK